ncbi:MAG: ATP-binding protein [bacterium]|nr:ATP-binding protein [bacterium]
MERFFNTAGPIIKEDHYCVPPLSRFDLDEILTLIGQKKYFVLHAPRQTGKTSYLMALMEYLNKEGKCKALYTNAEGGQAARENVDEAMAAILGTMAEEALFRLNDSYLDQHYEELLKRKGGLAAFQVILSRWCRQSDKPVVLLIDEIDSLIGDSLISLLRQIRSGYGMRPGGFPQSIILCGLRDVRDYRLHWDKTKPKITGGSPFNIKAKSLRLGSFNPDEIQTLYLEHTTETGQVFNKDIFPMVWKLTEGQPWLVNALAYEVCFDMKEGRDRSKEITDDMILQAKENLIIRRETHLHQLGDKLQENRVKKVLIPILSGAKDIAEIPEDDLDYVSDLGLIAKRPNLRIANRIYQEVIPRQLTYTIEGMLGQETAWYIKDDGSLDMGKLLTAFQDFFRKHFDSWVEGFNYKEAGAQLLLQAFLQRIVNGGGRVEREYGFGRERTDLLVVWPFNSKDNDKPNLQEVVIELKIKYGRLDTVIKKGLKQTKSYMDKCGTDDGYLVIFNRSPKTPWSKKIFKKKESYNGVNIVVFGM